MACFGVSGHYYGGLDNYQEYLAPYICSIMYPFRMVTAPLYIGAQGPGVGFQESRGWKVQVFASRVLAVSL